MIQALHQPIASFDLAGSWQADIGTKAVQQRIQYLVQHYLSLEHLSVLQQMQGWLKTLERQDLENLLKIGN